jgi:hypothetical protein
LSVNYDYSYKSYQMKNALKNTKSNYLNAESKTHNSVYDHEFGSQIYAVCKLDIGTCNCHLRSP